MDIDDMITLVCHAEYVANSRPLSFVTQNDQQHILTPNIMIFGRQMHQENWLDNDTFSDPDYTLISQNQLGEAFTQRITTETFPHLKPYVNIGQILRRAHSLKVH